MNHTDPKHSRLSVRKRAAKLGAMDHGELVLCYMRLERAAQAAISAGVAPSVEKIFNEVLDATERKL